MSSCLSNTSDPCEVIKHIFCNKNMYGKVVASLRNSRNARELGGMYCLYFCNPCDNSSITIKGNRILDIYENPCKICWCSNTEKVAGLTILNFEFFADVLLSFNDALQAKSDVKLFCKTFKIPRCLFPNISAKDSCFTITGKNIIKIMCLSLNGNCCETTK